MSPGDRDPGDEGTERWVPVPGKRAGDKGSGHGGGQVWQEPREAEGVGVPPERPEELFRQFFEMRSIPPEAEVVVTPSLRAAMDVPLKVVFVLLILFGPFTATGFFMEEPPGLVAPLALIYTVLQFWPLLLFVFAPAVRLKFTRYVVDAEGIRSRTQVLSVTEQRISWNKVTAIQYRRTLFDRLLGLERLSIIAYGERGATLRMIGLRDATQLRDLTAQKMREHATAEAIFSND